jgi:two-component system cell cycle response regulator
METRILVIEDDPASLELMGYLLRAFGYTPITVENGERGLVAAQDASPDLILCDIQLPGIDGHAVARRLKGNPVLAQIPLVAVTALAMVGDRDRVLASGFDGYISKPIVPETFVTQIEAFLPSRRRKSPEPAVAEEPAPLPPVARRNKGTILLVDDLKVNLTLLSSLLEPSGYKVLTSDNIKEALRLASQREPDLILSDLHLNNETGLELLRLVKSDPVLRSIPFIILSSTGWSSQSRTEAFELGADEFLLRPVEPPVIVAAVEDALGKHQYGKKT